MLIMKVSKHTQVSKLAQAIAGELRRNKTTQLRAIGREAGYIALKAITSLEHPLVDTKPTAIHEFVSEREGERETTVITITLHA